MFWKDEKNREETVDIYDKRERLFFHDIVNLTHGLILFLNQKQNSKKSINGDEIQILEKEVRSLQSLIKDHFQYKHKNLSQTYDWVPFNVAEIAVNSLIQTYLLDKSAQIFIRKNFKEENLPVYFPIFYRIMNNLIKNMAEAKSNEIHIDFKSTSEGFFIETRNQYSSAEDLKRISDNLSRIILDEKTKVIKQGLGLESIHYLAIECGGKFDFEISNNYWINRIFLPSLEQKKAA